MTDQLDALSESVGIALEGAWAAIKDADTWNALREYVEGLARENARLTEQMRLLAANQNERTDNALELWQRAEARVRELERENGECRRNEREAIRRIAEQRERAERAESKLAAIKTAARTYFLGYCQDEAADEIVEGRGHWTGCTKEQHEAAVRLRDALLPLDDEAKS